MSLCLASKDGKDGCLECKPDSCLLSSLREIVTRYLISLCYFYSCQAKKPAVLIPTLQEFNKKAKREKYFEFVVMHTIFVVMYTIKLTTK